MSQNNMISFITINSVDGELIELNPAYIAMMQRSTHDEIPCTNITLGSGVSITVMQTPEQIAQLQMDAVANLMESVMKTTHAIVMNMEEDGLY